MINMNLFTAKDHENMAALADLFETAEMAELFMTEHEFQDGISNAIETNFGDARVTGAMFANIARKFFQAYRDARHVKGTYGSAKDTAETIRAYIERHAKQ